MWANLPSQRSTLSGIIPAAVPPSPGSSYAMTDLFGGYEILVVLTYLGTDVKGYSIPRAPNAVTRVCCWASSQFTLSFWPILILFPLFLSHLRVPGHSLINILACKTSGFLFPGNPICHILSIKLWFSASHLLWCHNSRISLSLSSLQPHGPSFDNAGSPHLPFPVCVKPSLPHPSGPA